VGGQKLGISSTWQKSCEMSPNFCIIEDQKFKNEYRQKLDKKDAFIPNKHFLRKISEVLDVLKCPPCDVCKENKMSSYGARTMCISTRLPLTQ
jgi:hypothetical protein